MKLNEKVTGFLKDQRVWTIATFGGGKPHCVPCYHTAVVDSETLVVSAVFLRQTLANVKENGKVALTTFRQTPEGKFESYQIKGDAHLESSGALFDLGKSLVGDKPLPYQGALVIKIKEGSVSSPGPNVGKSFDDVQW